MKAAVAIAIFCLSSIIFCDNSKEALETLETAEASDEPSISICESREPSRDVAFVRVGRYRGFTDSGSEYQKTYLISRYATSTWFEAKAICKSFDLELASFETLTEAHTFLNVAKDNAFINTFGRLHLLVDGMTLTPKSSTDWYWTNTGRKVSFSLPWRPGEPNFANDLEYCLSVLAHEPSTVGFNDVSCQNHTMPFICQRIDYFVPVRLN